MHTNSSNCPKIVDILQIFIQKKGIMGFKRLCYGVNITFKIFQKAINQSLGNMPNTKFLSDGIIIYTKTLQEHIITIKRLFEKLRDLNLRLNRKKCIFLQEKISFFGVTLSKKGI